MSLSLSLRPESKMLLLFWLLLSLSLRHGRCAALRDPRPASQLNFLLDVVHGLEVNPELLDELMSDDLTAMSEGDIRLSTDRNAVGNIWSTLRIPYRISPELASQTDDLLVAMAMVSEHTCVSFHPRTSERDYLLFKTSKGCSSFVGFVGGEQPVFVGPRCTVGNVVHELLHALGFHHEHTRTDREDHVTILHSNIMAGREKNFRMRDGETFSLPYDITSILHYGSGFFSSNGLPTIIPKKDNENMGQRVKMTPSDIRRVRLLYKCDFFKPQKEPRLLADQMKSDHSLETPPPSNSTLQELHTTSRGQHHVTNITPPPSNSTLQELHTTSRGQHPVTNITPPPSNSTLQELHTTSRGQHHVTNVTPPPSNSTLQELHTTSRGQHHTD